MGLSQEFSILLFFFIKNFSREPCAGNLVYVCLFKREQKGGAGGRFWPRSDAISDPIGNLQTLTIVRVWHRA